MSVTAPAGFEASAVAAGIKGSGNLDMALVSIVGGRPVPAAATFTSNRAAAAPVLVSASHMAATGGMTSGVLLTSGNANAATGAEGEDHAERLCRQVAESMGVIAAPGCHPGHHVLICQTGLIGVPFPVEKASSSVGDLVKGRAGDAEHAAMAARAIMTTDTVPKEVIVRTGAFTIGGMAKGAAMLAPNMATMLAMLTTDADAQPHELQEILREAVSGTFNAMTVDGCTSTNDTVVLMASGRASGPAPSAEALMAAVHEACAVLAHKMVDDAEGATKTALISVKGASSDEEAARAARKVGESLLVKCSLNGEDPYWGRIASELGTAGIQFDMDQLSIFYGGTEVCKHGVSISYDTEAVAAHMRNRHIQIDCYLGLGTGTAEILTTDLGYGYIDENRTTS
ncbi:MAG: bifunctional glutamate N-acetyltransferase/amino-acid acetyltransferase ArgJ [Actinobacteria bacterium]|nr:bifunctional glutamate N-acetyltransferase/amino-acid acetyltransferase ArgJ [Actinomycetota bacterium]